MRGAKNKAKVSIKGAKDPEKIILIRHHFSLHTTWELHSYINYIRKQILCKWTMDKWGSASHSLATTALWDHLGKGLCNAMKWPQNFMWAQNFLYPTNLLYQLLKIVLSFNKMFNEFMLPYLTAKLHSRIWESFLVTGNYCRLMPFLLVQQIFPARRIKHTKITGLEEGVRVVVRIGLCPPTRNLLEF